MTSIKSLAENLNNALVLPTVLESALANINTLQSAGQLTVSTALQDRQISYYKREAGKQALGTLIMVWVLKLASKFKMSDEKNLNEDDAGDIAELILHQYWFLKLAEIRVFFERATMGKYGQVYDRFEQQTLFVWLEKYLQEREYEIARAREQKHKEQELPRDLSELDPKAATALREVINAFKRPLAAKIAATEIKPDNVNPYEHRFNRLLEWFPNLPKVVDRWVRIYKVKDYSADQFFAHPKIIRLESIIAERTGK